MCEQGAHRVKDGHLDELSVSIRCGLPHHRELDGWMEREAAADTVVLIHGLWMTPLSWEHWVTRYEQRGLRVITPGYPGVEPGTAGVEALRNDPSPLANLGVREIFDYLAEVITALDAKPIIMGPFVWRSFRAAPA
jgi:pimeloyl-ACP methyl ester carboxylesterase